MLNTHRRFILIDVVYITLFCVSLLTLSTSYATSRELLIDNFESIEGWYVGGGELTVGVSDKHVTEGKHSLNLHIEVDHNSSNTAEGGSDPIGWPSISKKYVPAISLEAYDFLEFDIFFESLSGRDPDDAISLIVRDSNGKTLYRTTLIDLRHGQWSHQKLCIRDIPFIDDFTRFNFFLSESSYEHGEILDFYIDNLRATKAVDYKSPEVSTTATLVAKYDSLILWSEGSCKKIMRTENVQFTEEPKHFLAMSAARNETEAVQLVLRPLKKGGVGQVSLEIGELVGLNGAKIGVGNISWSPVYYVPANEGPPEGLPDGLPGPKPFEADREWNYPVWLEVYVPVNTPAGDYVAPVVIQTGDEKIKVELRVHVWGFDIPTKQSLRTSTVIYGSFGWSEEISNWFGNMSYEQYVEQWRPDMVAMLAKYRLSPSVIRYLPIRYSEEKREVILGDTRKFEHAVQLNLSQGHSINRMGVPYFFDRETFLRAKKGSEAYLKRIADVYRIAAEYLESKGWLDGSYVYCVDEVVSHKQKYAQELDLLNKVFDTIRSAHPKIKLFGAETPSPIIRDMDIWCINMKYFDVDVVEEQHLLGKDVWWYNGFRAPRPGMAIAFRAVNHRALFWMNYKYGIDGYLIWTVNRWVNNPWKDPNRNEKTAAGNHFLFYPNPDGTVSPSLRISMMRDGLEDYEYHHLLAGAAKKLHSIGKIKLAAECEDTLKKADSFILAYDNCSYIQPNYIYESRRLLAEQLEEVWSFVNVELMVPRNFKEDN